MKLTVILLLYVIAAILIGNIILTCIEASATDLHKACLQNYQDCLMLCVADRDVVCNNDKVTVKAINCASDCVRQYNKCEEDLDTFRCLMDKVPISLETSGKYIPDIARGGYGYAK